MKKLIALLLCAVLPAALLAACNNDEPPERGAADDYENDYYEDYYDDYPWYHHHEGSSIFDAAFAAFAPDTVMITAGEYTVTWGELFFHLHNMLAHFATPYGIVIDLTEEMEGIGMTYADFVKEEIAQNAMFFKAIEYGAALSGVTLTDDDFEWLQNEIQNFMTFRGFEEHEAFLTSLWEDMGFYSVELFEYVMLTSSMVDSLAEVLQHNLSDEEVSEYAAANGYLMAKHILRMRDGEGDALAESEDILRRLRAYDGDDFTAFFTEMMFEYSEDTGSFASPGGYLFQFVDMVPEFSFGTVELEIGGLSDVIASQFGYHIILRMPIDYDAIPITFLMHGGPTLRGLASSLNFENLIFEWMDALNPQFTAAFESLNLAELFAFDEDDW